MKEKIERYPVDVSSFLKGKLETSAINEMYSSSCRFFRRLWFGLAVLWILPASARADESPEAVFRKAPESTKPGVWWHWMGCNVTKEGITRDLESFKSAGIGGATIFGMADSCTPWAAHIENSPTDGLLAFTDPWWQLVRHAAAEGKRLGIDVGLHNCPGYTSTGGPWITPELSMQQIFQSQTNVAGGSTFRGILPRPAVDPRGDVLFPFVNKQTGTLEKPVIEARNSYWRDIAVIAVPADGVIAMDQLIDLSGKMDSTGRIEWTAPAGSWVIHRFGHTTMGALTQPNQWEILGLECDKMSEKAVTFHLEHVLGEMRRHLGSLVGSGLKHVLLDSYEAGTPSWTPLMPEEFAQRRGYNLKAFLPIFAGRVVGSEEQTRRFRDDFNRTIADLYRDKLFATMARMLEKENLRFVCEPYGGPFDTGEASAHVHRVMTEFWSGQPFGGAPMQGIFNAGNGKRHNILEAEAFTGSPQNSQWTETPDGLKTTGDGAFCAGINRLVLHANPHQPWSDGVRPGMTMGQWGTHFGRTQTWWEPGKAWIAYLTRCQALLQWGAPSSTGGCMVENEEGGIKLQSIHRNNNSDHVFFIANTSRSRGAADVVFPVSSMQPEIWNPVTGEMRMLKNFQIAGDEVIARIEFAPAQSWFVVFRENAGESLATRRNFPEYKPISSIQGSWEVRFDPKWGGPEEPVEFSALVDWTTHAEPGIRYFSGSAVYRKTIDFTGNAVDPLYLDLGTVKHLARISLNGRDLGVVWCAPWGVNVPKGLLRPRGNQLEVVITNVWANRLIGDELEPPDCEWQPGYMGGHYLKRFPDWFVKGLPRPSKGRHTFTTWNYFDKNSQPVASGLLGPVRFMAENWSQAAVPLRPRTVRRTNTASSDAFESALPSIEQLVPLASIEEAGVPGANGGAGNAAPVHNGTTRNASGGAETLDDGKTFRGYGQGNSITFRLDLSRRPQGYDLKEIRSFAGHDDARASQSYSVSIATTENPGKFDRMTTASVSCKSGASIMFVPINASGVAAVRLDFGNGPNGFNVYREICLLPSEASK
jgi:hypothetical protein